MAAKTVIQVTGPGRPIAGARAGTFGRQRYTPEPYATWKRKARVLFLAANGMRPMDAEIRLTVSVHFRGKGFVRRHTTRPDIDNVALKGIMDAGNGILWHDDAQVCEVHAQKWAGGGGEPYVLVLVEAIQ